MWHSWYISFWPLQYSINYRIYHTPWFFIVFLLPPPTASSALPYSIHRSLPLSYLVHFYRIPCYCNLSYRTLFACYPCYRTPTVPCPLRSSPRVRRRPAGTTATRAPCASASRPAIILILIFQAMPWIRGRGYGITAYLTVAQYRLRIETVIVRLLLVS